MIRVLDSAGSTLVEWGRQQQHDSLILVSKAFQNETPILEIENFFLGVLAK